MSSYSKEFYDYLKAIGLSSHTVIYVISYLLSGFIIGFINGWKFSGLLALSIPLMLVGLAGHGSSLMKSAERMKNSSKKAN